MQTLKLSVALPDDTHPDVQLRLSANDAGCDVLISLPLRVRREPVGLADLGYAHSASAAHDDCVLGGYAGI